MTVDPSHILLMAIALIAALAWARQGSRADGLQIEVEALQAKHDALCALLAEDTFFGFEGPWNPGEVLRDLDWREDGRIARDPSGKVH